MQVEEVKISDIENHPKNPKQHPEKQIRLIEKSMKRFGWTNPVLLSADGVILAGHARVKAAIEQGHDTVPCIRTKLTGKEADAYLLADNRLSDIAPYDRDILAELLADIPSDLAEITGFDSVQVEALLSGEEIPDIDKFISDSQPEFIIHDPDSERAGASPWERMGGDSADGVIFTFGSITCKIDTGVYGAFLKRVEQQPEIKIYVTGILTNAI